MFAFRQVQKVKSGIVTIAVPPDLYDQQVEIIVFPVDELIIKHEKKRKKLLKLLRQAPTLTDEEIVESENSINRMRKWNIQEF